MKILSILFGITILVLTAMNLILKRKKKESFNIEIIIFVCTLLVFFFGIISERQSEREFRKTKLETDKQIDELNNSNLILNNEISLNIYETEKLKRERDSILLKIKEADIRLYHLRKSNDDLVKKTNYERLASYNTESKSIENREICQFGPIIDDLNKIKDVSLHIRTIDNGEAINTRDRLISVFNLIKWNIKSNLTFYGTDFEYLIPKEDRINNNIAEYYSEGIYIVYYDHFFELNKLYEAGDKLAIKRFIETHDIFKESDSEIAATILKDNLIAMGTYARLIPLSFDNSFDINPSEIYVIIGKKPLDEKERTYDCIELDPHLKMLSLFYKNSKVQIRNNISIKK